MAAVEYLEAPTCTDAGMAFIGARCTRIREAAGFDSQLALAQKMGRSSTTILRWENESRNPGADDLYELAETLGVSCEEFAKDVDAPIRWKRKPKSAE